MALSFHVAYLAFLTSSGPPKNDTPIIHGQRNTGDQIGFRHALGACFRGDNLKWFCIFYAFRATCFPGSALLTANRAFEISERHPIVHSTVGSFFYRVIVPALWAYPRQNYLNQK